MGLYCGIDLHATNSWLCVIDGEGRARLETRVPNQLEVVRNRTARLLTLQNVLARETGRRIVGNELRRQTMDELSRLGLSRETNLVLSSSLEIVALLDEKIVEIERAVVRGTRTRPELRRLRTVGGIGKALGLTILLETGEISRFRSVGNYVSYGRLVATARKSNERKKGEGNRKNGNPYLSWAFSEAAHFACRFQPAARRFFDRKRARTNDIVAIRALAHKLARACYFILRDGVAYDPSLVFRT